MKKTLTLIAVPLALLLVGCGGSTPDTPKQEVSVSLLDYCSQAYGEFNGRHPELVPELTPEEQCASGIEEGIYSTPAEVDALLKAFE